MSVIVKTISAWVKILIVLFGIHTILFGDMSPGGGFAGGVILASSYVLLMLAFGGEFATRNFAPARAVKLISAGAILLLTIASSGLLLGKNGFFCNFIFQNYLADKNMTFSLISAGTIPFAHIAIGLVVASALFLIIMTLAKFRPESTDNRKE